MILFITRKYPPVVGGMQKQSFELTKSIQKLYESYIISWGKSQIFLPWFFLSAFTKSCWIIITKNVELIHLGDAFLSPLGYILGVIFGIPVVTTAHGLDVVFKFKPYQMLIPRFIKHLDKIICVSEQTRQQVLMRGIQRWKTTVIPNGITIQNNQSKLLNNSHSDTRGYVEKMINQDLIGKTILLTVGRLVKRKGVNYFIRKVLPGILAIENEVFYFVAGDGFERNNIKHSIEELNLGNHVFLFGQTDKDLLDSLYSIADIFVMPNIPVEGDFEGFGIVALEAGLAGLPVVASDLEGIKDAVTHGENGYLIDSKDAKKFISTIINLIRDPSYNKELGNMASQFVISRYSWDRIGEQYLKEFKTVMKNA